MEDDFVDVFPSAGGVGDSPVKGLPDSSSNRPALSLSIPTGLESGGREALVSPAVTEGLGKESLLRSARAVSEASESGLTREEDVVMLDTPSESPSPARGVGLMPLTIEAGGGECMPTELEKKRAKLEKYRYECSEVGGDPGVLLRRLACAPCVCVWWRNFEKAVGGTRLERVKSRFFAVVLDKEKERARSSRVEFGGLACVVFSESSWTKPRKRCGGGQGPNGWTDTVAGLSRAHVRVLWTAYTQQQPSLDACARPRQGSPHVPHRAIAGASNTNFLFCPTFRSWGWSWS